MGGALLAGGISDWQGMRLIPGKLTVLNQGEYIGQGFLNPAEFDDTLFIDFGIEIIV